MTKLSNVTAQATRSGKWWAIEVPEIPGLFTQTRRLDQVEAQVKDAGNLLGYEIDKVMVDAHLNTEDTALLAQLSQAKNTALTAQEKASSLLRATVDTLQGQGMTMRDIATLIGVTPQRVSAVANS